MSTELKESMKMISHQIENINKEREITNKEPNRNSGFKVTRTKMRKIH